MDIIVTTDNVCFFITLSRPTHGSPSKCATARCYHSEALVWIHKLVLEHKLETFTPSLIPELFNPINYLQYSQPI